MYIEIKNLSFQYEKNHPVLKDCDMNIEQGKIVSIIGNSGSGKSTFLRIIAGLEKSDAGELWIQQQLLFSHNTFIEPHQRNIGMVFQDYALFPHLKVSENIIFGLHKKSKTEKEMTLKEMLALISLDDKESYYPHELSGGQQQRVAIARSLASKPKLLLLDEPFSNLDTTLKKQIRNDLASILRESKMTCIFATHDLEDAIDIADEIFILDNHKLVKYEESKNLSHK